MKKLLLPLMFFLLSQGFAAQVDLRSKNTAGHVIFEAIGRPAMIKIKGEGPAPKTIMTFKDGVVSLQSVLDLDQLKTGIDLRDEHMKEKYLETKKFPKAKLTINSLKVPANWDQTATSIGEQEFSGTLELHGQERPVSGKYTLNDKQEAQADFQIKLTEFGIEIPDYMGITVAELVTIKTLIQFEK